MNFGELQSNILSVKNDSKVLLQEKSELELQVNELQRELEEKSNTINMLHADLESRSTEEADLNQKVTKFRFKK